MYSVTEVVFFILLIIGAGISGIILIVTGIMNKNSLHWALGSVIVTVAVILTAILIGRGISSYYKGLHQLIEIQHQYDDDIPHSNDTASSFITYDNKDFQFLNSFITEYENPDSQSLFSFSVYADDSLFKKGFYVSNALIHNNQTYQFTIRTEYNLNSNIQLIALDDENLELFNTEMTIELTAGQSSVCIFKSTTGNETIPVSFLFRII